MKENEIRLRSDERGNRDKVRLARLKKYGKKAKPVEPKPAAPVSRRGMRNDRKSA